MCRSFPWKWTQFWVKRMSSSRLTPPSLAEPNSQPIYNACIKFHCNYWYSIGQSNTLYLRWFQSQTIFTPSPDLRTKHALEQITSHWKIHITQKFKNKKRNSPSPLSTNQLNSMTCKAISCALPSSLELYATCLPIDHYAFRSFTFLFWLLLEVSTHAIIMATRDALFIDDCEDRRAMFPSNDAGVGRNRNCIPVETRGVRCHQNVYLGWLLVCPFWYFVYRQLWLTSIDHSIYLWACPETIMGIDDGRGDQLAKHYFLSRGSILPRSI